MGYVCFVRRCGRLMWGRDYVLCEGTQSRYATVSLFDVVVCKAMVQSTSFVQPVYSCSSVLLYHHEETMEDTVTRL
jgi:hypothetical protein